MVCLKLIKHPRRNIIVLKMNLKRYWMENIAFNLNSNALINLNNKAIKISPEFKREIIEVDENNAIVKITMRVSQTEEIPFNVYITVCGAFECEKWKESEDGQGFIKITTVQVLFPYLRQAVSTITGMANIPPYVLPIVNVRTLFEKDN